MGTGNTTSNDILSWIFCAVPATWMGTGVLGGSPITSVFIALHTADPLAAGYQNTSECTYTGPYARVAVPRTTGPTGWTVATQAVTNAALIQFPTCTGSTSTATYFSIGTLTSGAGQILFSGQLGSSLAISNNITPQFAIGAISVTES